MGSIYDTDIVILPSVAVPRWMRDRAYHYKDVYNLTWAIMVRDFCSKLIIVPGSGYPGLANWRKDLQETVYRMTDEYIQTRQIQGKIKPPYTPLNRPPYQKSSR